MAATTAVAADSRFACIDGYRALASLAVVATHGLLVFGSSFSTATMVAIGQQGSQVAVALFFVASGFVLYRPFVVAALDGRPQPRIGAFYVRRLFRIFPAYWVALATYLFLVVPDRGRTPLRETFLLVQGYRRGHIDSGLPVGWTLVIELSFYLALPLMAIGLHRIIDVRNRFDDLVLALCGIGALGFVARGAWFTVFTSRTAGLDGWFPLSQIGAWLPGRLDTFALGMLLAAWSARARADDGASPPLIVRWIAQAPVAAVVLAGLLTWMAITLAVTGGDALGQFAQTVIWTPVAGLLLIPAVFGTDGGGPVRRLLLSRPLQFLGLVSYGTYLWHPGAMAAVRRWGPAAIERQFAAQFTVAVVLTILAAAISYVLIESPAINLSRRITRGRRVVA